MMNKNNIHNNGSFGVGKRVLSLLLCVLFLFSMDSGAVSALVEPAQALAATVSERFAAAFERVQAGIAARKAEKAAEAEADETEPSLGLKTDFASVRAQLEELSKATQSRKKTVKSPASTRSIPADHSLDIVYLSPPQFGEGDDANSGVVPEEPVATLAAAEQRLAPGGTVALTAPFYAYFEPLDVIGANPDSPVKLVPESSSNNLIFISDLNGITIANVSASADWAAEEALGLNVYSSWTVGANAALAGLIQHLPVDSGDGENAAPAIRYTIPPEQVPSDTDIQFYFPIDDYGAGAAVFFSIVYEDGEPVDVSELTATHIDLVEFPAGTNASAALSRFHISELVTETGFHWGLRVKAAQPNVIEAVLLPSAYWDPLYGSDDNDGLTPETPVFTANHAMEITGADGNVVMLNPASLGYGEALTVNGDIDASGSVMHFGVIAPDTFDSHSITWLGDYAYLTDDDIIMLRAEAPVEFSLSSVYMDPVVPDEVYGEYRGWFAQLIGASVTAGENTTLRGGLFCTPRLNELGEQVAPLEYTALPGADTRLVFSLEFNTANGADYGKTYVMNPYDEGSGSFTGAALTDRVDLVRFPAGTELTPDILSMFSLMCPQQAPGYTFGDYGWKLRVKPEEPNVIEAYMELLDTVYIDPMYGYDYYDSPLWPASPFRTLAKAVEYANENPVIKRFLFKNPVYELADSGPSYSDLDGYLPDQNAGVIIDRYSGATGENLLFFMDGVRSEQMFNNDAAFWYTTFDVNIAPASPDTVIADIGGNAAWQFYMDGDTSVKGTVRRRIDDDSYDSGGALRAPVHTGMWSDLNGAPLEDYFRLHFIINVDADSGLAYGYDSFNGEQYPKESKVPLVSFYGLQDYGFSAADVLPLITVETDVETPGKHWNVSYETDPYGDIVFCAELAQNTETVYWNPSTIDKLASDGTVLLPAGNDSNDGLTPATAVLTLNRAINSVAAGGTVIQLQSQTLPGFYGAAANLTFAGEKNGLRTKVVYDTDCVNMFTLSTGTDIKLSGLEVDLSAAADPLYTVMRFNGGAAAVGANTVFKGNIHVEHIGEAGTALFTFTETPQAAANDIDLTFALSLNGEGQVLGYSGDAEYTSSSVVLAEFPEGTDASALVDTSFSLNADAIAAGWYIASKLGEPNVIYAALKQPYDGAVYLSGMGSDDNTGLYPESPVASFERAMAILTGDTDAYADIADITAERALAGFAPREGVLRIVAAPVKVLTTQTWTIPTNAADPASACYWHENNDPDGAVIPTYIERGRDISDPEHNYSGLLISVSSAQIPSADPDVISIGSGRLTLRDITIRGSSANADAAGDNSIISLSDGLYGGTQLILGEGAVLAENTSSGNGGAVKAGGGTLIVENGAVITGNKTLGSGGGIYVSSGTMGGSVTLNAGAVISNNAAAGDGGGIYCSNIESALTLAADAPSQGGETDRVVISGNTAGGNGGGLCFGTKTGQYYSRPGSLSVLGGLFTDNKAGLNGGGLFAAVYHASSLTLTHAEITHNKAEQGGGIYTNAPFTMLGGDIAVENNEARLYGGGVYLNGAMALYDEATGETVLPTLTLDGAVIAENRIFAMGAAQNDLGELAGGGVYLQDASLLLTNGAGVNENEIVHNVELDCSAYGGGVCHRGAGDVRIQNGSTVDSNRVEQWNASNRLSVYGGGLYYNGSGTLEFSGPITATETFGGTVNGNLVRLYNGSLRAAGLYVEGNNEAAVRILGSAVNNNLLDIMDQPDYGHMDVSGVGAYIHGADVTLGGASATAPKASVSGNRIIGGVYPNGYLYIRGEGVGFVQYGGAFSGGSFSVTENTVCAPTIPVFASYGGGMLLSGVDCRCRFGETVGIEIRGNSPGGLALLDLTDTWDVSEQLFIRNMEFADNLLGTGLYVRSPVRVALSNCTFSGNGSGLYVEAASHEVGSTDVYVSNCTFTGAQGVVRHTTSEENDGGGACLIGDRILVENCNFNGNKAFYYGGGLTVRPGVSAYINGCAFSANELIPGPIWSIQGDLGMGEAPILASAESIGRGGCLYVSGGSGSVTTVDGCAFGTNDVSSRNIADYGGAIYQNGEELVVTGNTSFVYNYAEKGAGIYTSARSGVLRMESCSFESLLNITITQTIPVYDFDAGEWTLTQVTLPVNFFEDILGKAVYNNAADLYLNCTDCKLNGNSIRLDDPDHLIYASNEPQDGQVFNIDVKLISDDDSVGFRAGREVVRFLGTWAWQPSVLTGHFDLIDPAAKAYILTYNYSRSLILSGRGVYVDGVNGSDTYAGLEPYRAKKTMNAALQVLKEYIYLAPELEPTIYVVNTVYVDSSETWAIPADMNIAELNPDGSHTGTWLSVATVTVRPFFSDSPYPFTHGTSPMEYDGSRMVAVRGENTVLTIEGTLLKHFRFVGASDGEAYKTVGSAFEVTNGADLVTNHTHILRCETGIRVNNAMLDASYLTVSECRRKSGFGYGPAAIYANNSAVTINNGFITENVSETVSAVRFENCSMARLINVRFQNNETSSAANSFESDEEYYTFGVALTSIDSHLIASGCYFENNARTLVLSTQQNGYQLASSSIAGAVGVTNTDQAARLVRFEDCVFTGNYNPDSSDVNLTAPYNYRPVAAVCLKGKMSADFTNCTFSDNRGYMAGAIYATYYYHYRYSSVSSVPTEYFSRCPALTLTGCLFGSAELDHPEAGNVGSYAGAVYTRGSRRTAEDRTEGRARYINEPVTLTVTDCTFRENRTDYFRNSMFNPDNVAANVKDYGGGAVHAYYTTGTFNDVFCSGNGLEYFGAGGAVNLNQSDFSFSGGMYAGNYVNLPMRMGVNGFTDEYMPAYTVCGGAFAIFDSTVTFDSDNIIGNAIRRVYDSPPVTTTYLFHVPRIMLGGGLYASGNTVITMNGCQISENSLVDNSDYTTEYDSQLTNRTAPMQALRGAGVYLDGRSPYTELNLNHCRLQHNYADAVNEPATGPVEGVQLYSDAGLVHIDTLYVRNRVESKPFFEDALHFHQCADVTLGGGFSIDSGNIKLTGDAVSSPYPIWLSSPLLPLTDDTNPFAHNVIPVDFGECYVGHALVRPVNDPDTQEPVLDAANYLPSDLVIGVSFTKADSLPDEWKLVDGEVFGDDNTIYVESNNVYLASFGVDDEAHGYSPEMPVKTFAYAKQRLREMTQSGELHAGADIVICGKVTVNSVEKWNLYDLSDPETPYSDQWTDFRGATWMPVVRRYIGASPRDERSRYRGAMVHVVDNGMLILEGITLDGGFDTTEDGALCDSIIVVSCNYNADSSYHLENLVLQAEAVLRNGGAKYGGAVRIENGYFVMRRENGQETFDPPKIMENRAVSYLNEYLEQYDPVGLEFNGKRVSVDDSAAQYNNTNGVSYGGGVFMENGFAVMQDNAAFSGNGVFTNAACRSNVECYGAQLCVAGGMFRAAYGASFRNARFFTDFGGEYDYEENYTAYYYTGSPNNGRIYGAVATYATGNAPGGSFELLHSAKICNNFVFNENDSYQNIPILIIDPETGEVLERLSMPNYTNRTTYCSGLFNRGTARVSGDIYGNVNGATVCNEGDFTLNGRIFANNTRIGRSCVVNEGTFVMDGANALISHANTTRAWSSGLSELTNRYYKDVGMIVNDLGSFTLRSGRVVIAESNTSETMIAIHSSRDAVLTVNGGEIVDESGVASAGIASDSELGTGGEGIFVESINGAENVVRIHEFTDNIRIASNRLKLNYSLIYNARRAGLVLNKDAIADLGVVTETEDPGISTLSVNGRASTRSVTEVVSGAKIYDSYNGILLYDQYRCTVNAVEVYDISNSGVRMENVERKVFEQGGFISGNTIYDYRSNSLLTFTSAHAVIHDCGYGDTPELGGGLYVNGGVVSIEDCDIYNNKAGYGGGVYAGPKNNSFLLNGSIHNNTALQKGGGVCLHGGGYVSNPNTEVFTLGLRPFRIGVKDSTLYAHIFDNTANEGGGIALLTSRNSPQYRKNYIGGTGNAYARSQVEFTVTGAFVQNNRALNGNGGGVYIGKGLYDYSVGMDVSFIDCDISGNTASGSGGGIYVQGNNAVLYESWNNGTSSGSVGYPGPLNCNIDICRFLSNRAENGGGIYAERTSVHNSYYPCPTALNVSGTELTENTVSGNGGAVVFINRISGAPKQLPAFLNDVKMWNASASGNGGAAYFDNCDVNILNADIREVWRPDPKFPWETVGGAKAGGDGGAIWMDHGARVRLYKGILKGEAGVNNENGANGNGIYVGSADLVFTDNLMQIYEGSDIYLADVLHPILVQTTFTNTERVYEIYPSLQYHAGDIVVHPAPEGPLNDVTGLWPNFISIRPGTVIERRAPDLILGQIIFLDGVNGADPIFTYDPVTGGIVDWTYAVVDGVEHDGSTPDKAFYTFAASKTVLGNSAGGIYVCGTVTVSDAQTWSLASNQSLRRYTGFKISFENEYPAFADDMVHVAAGGELKIGALNVQGRFGGVDTYIASGSAFAVLSGGSLEFADGAKLTNHHTTGNGAAARVEEGGSLLISGGLIEKNNTYDGGCGAAVYQNGYTAFSGTSLIVRNTVYLAADKTVHVVDKVSPGEGGLSEVTAAMDFRPASSTQILLDFADAYNGRDVVVYPQGVLPGVAQKSLFRLPMQIASLYRLVNEPMRPNVLELQQTTAVYVDGVHGVDLNDGATPDTAVLTLKRAYQLLASGATDAAGGGTIYVVDTVTLNTAGLGVLLGSAYSDTAGNTYDAKGAVALVRYVQPTAHEALTGFSHATNLNELIVVDGTVGVIMDGILADGHSAAVTSEATADITLVSDGVTASSPLFGVTTAYAEGTEYGLRLTGNTVLQNASSNAQNGGALFINGGAADISDTVEIAGCTDSLGRSVYQNGTLLVSGEPALLGDVFLGAEKYITVTDMFTPVQPLSLTLDDAFHGRAIADYDETYTGYTVPGDTEKAYYALPGAVTDAFNLNNRASDSSVLELQARGIVYIDGLNGNDAKDGLTPRNAVKTLKRAYEILAQYNGSTVMVCGRITLNEGESVTLMGDRYVTSSDMVVAGGSVTFLRYSKPAAYASLSSDYNVSSYTGALFSVPADASLTLDGVTLNGHRYELTVGDARIDSPGVEANSSLISVRGDLTLKGGTVLLENNNVSQLNNDAGGIQCSGGTVYFFDAELRDNYHQYACGIVLSNPYNYDGAAVLVLDGASHPVIPQDQTLFFENYNGNEDTNRIRVTGALQDDFKVVFGVEMPFNGRDIIVFDEETFDTDVAHERDHFLLSSDLLTQGYVLKMSLEEDEPNTLELAKEIRVHYHSNTAPDQEYIDRPESEDPYLTGDIVTVLPLADTGLSLPPGAVFKGWNYKPDGTGSWFLPPEWDTSGYEPLITDENGQFVISQTLHLYAIYEIGELESRLTIYKYADVDDLVDPNRTFLFEIEDVGEVSSMRGQKYYVYVGAYYDALTGHTVPAWSPVTSPGMPGRVASVSVYGLPESTYRVRELTDWSWRYELTTAYGADASSSGEGVVDANLAVTVKLTGQASVSFVNTLQADGFTGDYAGTYSNIFARP